MLVQNLGGQTKSTMVFSEVAYSISIDQCNENAVKRSGCRNKQTNKQTNKQNKYCFLFSMLCFSPYTKLRLSSLVYHSGVMRSDFPGKCQTHGCFTGCNRSQTPGWHAFKRRVLNWIKTTFQPFLDIYFMNTVADMKYIHPVKGNPTSDQTVIS